MLNFGKLNFFIFAGKSGKSVRKTKRLVSLTHNKLIMLTLTYFYENLEKLHSIIANDIFKLYGEVVIYKKRCC